MPDNTKRFSDRVEDYIKYRPNYPPGLVPALEKAMKLNGAEIVADIGSGTGLSSLPFLTSEYKVLGIEPNKEMREAAEKQLESFTNFKSINGEAEKTNLPANSVDVILCGQAFHWFDRQKSKIEFARILTKEGNIVLVWNERSIKNNFQKEYEKILFDNIEEYRILNHRNIDPKLISDFFTPKKMNKLSLENKQTLSFAGLVGHLRSSSYFPKSGAQHDKTITDLRLLFQKYKEEETVVFEYETKVYWC
jgi:ubiquinone/menaquinone biosynthesis C-methylase UbiE